MQRLCFFMPDALKKYSETRQQARIQDDEKEKKRIERRKKREHEREHKESQDIMFKNSSIALRDLLDTTVNGGARELLFV